MVLGQRSKHICGSKDHIKKGQEQSDAL